MYQIFDICKNFAFHKKVNTLKHRKYPFFSLEIFSYVIITLSKPTDTFDAVQIYKIEIDTFNLIGVIFWKL